MESLHRPSPSRCLVVVSQVHVAWKLGDESSQGGAGGGGVGGGWGGMGSVEVGRWVSPVWANERPVFLRFEWAVGARGVEDHLRFGEDGPGVGLNLRT